MGHLGYRCEGSARVGQREGRPDRFRGSGPLVLVRLDRSEGQQDGAATDSTRALSDAANRIKCASPLRCVQVVRSLSRLPARRCRYQKALGPRVRCRSKVGDAAGRFGRRVGLDRITNERAVGRIAKAPCERS